MEFFDYYLGLYPKVFFDIGDMAAYEWCSFVVMHGAMVIVVYCFYQFVLFVKSIWHVPVYCEHCDKLAREEDKNGFPCCDEHLTSSSDYRAIMGEQIVALKPGEMDGVSVNIERKDD